MHNDPPPDLSKSLKRVNQACARCKIKKVKCCGSTPCSRCKADDAVCFYGVRGGNDKRMVSKTHVDRLQLQQKILIAALVAMWNKHERPHLPPALAEEDPSLHRIVASTGVLQGELNAQNIFESCDASGDDMLISPDISPIQGPEVETSQSRRPSELEHEMDLSPSGKGPSTLPLLDTDLNGPDPNANHWLDFLSFPLSPDMISPMNNSSAPKQSLAQRRGSHWIPHCPMPSLTPDTLTNSSGDQSTTITNKRPHGS